LYRPRSLDYDQIRIIDKALEAAITGHLFNYGPDGDNIDIEICKELYETFNYRLRLEKALRIVDAENG
jgi:hypothetical protein